MKRDLLVGVAQWLPTPGDAALNLSVALGMVDDAAARGVELLVLPELWSCGYDPETLSDDAWRDAEALDGPRARALGEAARRHDLFFVAGSVPEMDEAVLYDTVLAFNQRGDLAAWHRKTHLYPPTLEHSVFTAGDRLTTFDDPMLGRVGLVAGFEGDVPEVARALALARGAPGAGAVGRPRWSGRRRGTSCIRRRALANSQWWVQANQAGSHACVDPARSEPDHRAHRHRGCRGERRGPGRRRHRRVAGAPHRPPPGPSARGCRRARSRTSAGPASTPSWSSG